MSGLVIAFDTSTEVCAVAVLRVDPPVAPGAGAEGEVATGVELLATEAIEVGRSHTRLLLHSLDRVLGAAGAEVGDLGAVVVGTGPGTFTGVRIAVAAARALALSRGLPVLGVPTLGALAAAAAEGLPTGILPARMPRADSLVPVVDARRGQVFAGLYRQAPGPEGGSLWARASEYAAVDPDRLGEQIEAWGGEHPLMIGDARLLERVPFPGLDLRVGAGALVRGQSLLQEPGSLPLGLRLLPWLRRRLFARDAAAEGVDPGNLGASTTVEVPGEPGSPESVRPLYVRTPDADLHITRMRDPWASRA